MTNSGPQGELPPDYEANAPRKSTVMSEEELMQKILDVNTTPPSPRLLPNGKSMDLPGEIPRIPPYPLPPPPRSFGGVLIPGVVVRHMHACIVTALSGMHGCDCAP